MTAVPCVLCGLVPCECPPFRSAGYRALVAEIAANAPDAEALGDLVEPTCGAETFAHRISIMGASIANLRVEPDAAGAPWRPWASPVMILAGLSGDGEPWLYLACRACGWFLGYSAQYMPAELARRAAEHAAECDALGQLAEAPAASNSGGAP